MMSRFCAVETTGWVFIVIIFAFFIEILSLMLLHVGLLSNITYLEPEASETEVNKYIKERDPVLGWPGKNWLKKNTEGFGARISPANQLLSTQPVCLSVYGDSFAYSDEVEHEYAWPNELAEIFGCRVLNFGVSGYGTDQALLRFEHHLANNYPIGKKTILTVYPDNLNRNVNEWRYLLSGNKFGFKPVFESSNGVYREKPLIDLDFQIYKIISKNPELFFETDFFTPEKSFLKSKIRVDFPYSISLIKSLWRFFSSINPDRLGARLNFMNLPAWYDTRAGMAPEKRRVLRYIFERFSDDCRRYNIDCTIILLPDPELFMMLEEYGKHDLGFIKNIIPDDVNYIDLTNPLAESFEKEFCFYHIKPVSCSGHFNIEGYRKVAQTIFKHLK